MHHHSNHKGTCLTSIIFSWTIQRLGPRLFPEIDFPEIWAEGLICPIHRRDSKNIAENYRKITVLPVLDKIFESVLNS